MRFGLHRQIGGERSEFLALLRALIEDNYIKGLRANLSYDVVYGAETPGKDGAVVVKTEIKTQRRGRPIAIAVDYVLVNQGGKMRCFDVVTDGVGLVANYRSQFNKIIQKDGFAGLISRMKKKRQSG